MANNDVPPGGITIDIATAPTELAMKMIMAAIGSMGAQMAHRALDPMLLEPVEQQYGQIMSSIERLAGQLDGVVRTEIPSSSPYGISLLAVLQVAVWHMQRYIGMLESGNETRYEVDNVHIAQAPLEGREQADEFGGAPDNGYVLRRKTRGDH